MNNFDFNRYISFVDEISNDMNYPNSIRHLLYVVVPAFIINYEIENERLILECFRKTKIYLSNNILDNNVNAYFDRKLYKDDSYYSHKFIVIRKNDVDRYITFIDSIVHEFNHALNSMVNEINFDKECITLRTGISFIKYDTNLNPINKDDSFVLEEVINTKQTIDIINVISNMSSYNIENIEVSNLLQAINGEIKNIDYKSDAYYLETTIAKPLLDNKTFSSTLKQLRLKGEIDGVRFWFDNITGNSEDYDRLINLFYEVYSLTISFSKRVFFKNSVINKIKSKKREIEIIISTFNTNCLYK